MSIVQKIREDDFVHNIVADPADPPDTLLIVGFVGRSPAAEHTRVYLDVLLSSYVDVPDQAILFAREIAREQSPLGGWYVWVRRDVELVERLKTAYRNFQQVQQDYLNELQRNSFVSNAQPGWPVMPSQ
jgi:hypothetical protein